MASNRKFGVPINLLSLASDPASADEGDVYYNTTDDRVRVYKNSTWVNLAYADDVGITSTDYITFDTTPEATIPATQGTLSWDSGESGLNLTAATGVDVHLGQQNIVLVKNATGSSIPKGSVVYINGAAGQRPTIALSDADTEATSSKTLGLTAETIADTAEGFVTTFGVQRGINTLGMTEGAAVWLSSTAGAYTTTIPAEPAHSVFIGYVVKASATAGEIFVNPQNGYELNELHGVSIDGTPADNEVLAYDTTSGLWINQTASEAGLEPTISAGTTSQYWRGDKSWQTLNKSAVGLSNVENTALSTWAGSTNITTLGTISTVGTINGTTIPSNKTLVVTTDKLSALASTSSSELAGVISDETGSGALVFGTSPTITTPTLSNTVTLSGTPVIKTANSASTTLGVSITTGDTSGALTDSGSITIDTGTIVGGTQGTVSVGNVNASSVTVGRSGGTVNIPSPTTITTSSGLTIRSAATQDGIVLNGRAGGTNSYSVTISPTTLTGSRTLTLANGNTTLVAGTMAPTDSPTFTGTPAAPTAAADTNTTQIATTAYVIGQGYLKSSTASSTYAPLSGATFTGDVVVDGTLTVNGTTTTLNVNSILVDDKNIEMGSVGQILGVTATLSTGTAVVTVTSAGGTSGMIPGQTLTKTAGTGAFGASATILSVDSSTQFTASVNHSVAGAITFTVGAATDVTADGGGITLKGTTDKTFNWVDATDAWTSSEHINLASGKAYYINGTSVLNATTLGSGVTASSLTSFGSNPTLSGTITLANTPIIKTANSASTTSNISITTGDTSGALTDSGSITIDPGSIVGGTAGTVSIGNTRASAITIGNGSSSTNIVGAWKLGGTEVTTTATKLNYLTSATGTTGTASANIVFSTSPTITTSLITDTTGTFTLLNTNATTITAFGSATTLNLSVAGTVTSLNIGTNNTNTLSVSLGSGATSSGNTKTVNIGNAAGAGSTTAINLGTSGTAGSMSRVQWRGELFRQNTSTTTANAWAVGSGGGGAFSIGAHTQIDDTGSTATVAHRPWVFIAQPTFDSTASLTLTNASTLYIANAPTAGSANTTITNAYAMYIAAGASYIGGTLNVASTLTTTSPSFTTSVTTASTTMSVFNTTATTVNAFGAATSLNMGAATGTTTIANALNASNGFQLAGSSVTSTATQLNYLSSASGTTGTSSTNIVFSTSPTITTPTLSGITLLSGTASIKTAGSSGSTTAITIQTGDTSGNLTTSGNIVIDTGSGGANGSSGSISIGATNSGSVTINSTGGTTTLAGTTNISGTFQLAGTSVTTTAAKLNYLTSAAGTTGTTSTNLVFSTSPSITTPTLSGTVTLSSSPQIVTGTNTSAGITIQTGDANTTPFTVGSITIDTGAASGSGGSSATVSIGTANSKGVNIGRTGQTTDIRGNIQVNSSSGTAGYVLTSAGASAAPTWSAVSSPDVRRNVISGYYYGPATENTTAGSTQALIADRLVAVPFLTGPTGFTTSTISVEVTATAASSSVKLLIYNSNAAGTLPDTVLANAGAVSTSSTTGAKELNLSQALQPNTLYWLVCVSNGAPTLRARNSSTLGIPFNAITQLSSTPGSWYKDAVGSYTTPPTFGTPTGLLTTQMGILVKAA